MAGFFLKSLYLLLLLSIKKDNTKQKRLKPIKCDVPVKPIQDWSAWVSTRSAWTALLSLIRLFHIHRKNTWVLDYPLITILDRADRILGWSEPSMSIQSKDSGQTWEESWFVCLVWCLISQSTALVMSGRYLGLWSESHMSTW